MPSIRLPESIAKLSKTSNTMLSFPSSTVNIGASQYKNIAALTLNTATIGIGGIDAALQTNSTYYVYAVVSSGVLAIIGSLNSSLPSGFSAAKTVGIFNTNNSSLIGFPDVPMASTTTLPGQIVAYGGALAPAGWLSCDGSIISRTTYSALFSALSTTWGSGDGSTTFALPDLRGVYIKGAGTTNRGAGKDSAGNYYAGTLANYDTDRIQGHAHSVTVPNQQGSSWQLQGTVGGQCGQAEWSNTNNANITFAPYGAPRTGYTTEPQSAGVNYIIKY
jgi:microcystin-dependent protein